MGINTGPLENEVSVSGKTEPKNSFKDILTEISADNKLNAEDSEKVNILFEQYDKDKDGILEESEIAHIDALKNTIKETLNSGFVVGSKEDYAVIKKLTEGVLGGKLPAYESFVNPSDKLKFGYDSANNRITVSKMNMGRGGVFLSRYGSIALENGTFDGNNQNFRVDYNNSNDNSINTDFIAEAEKVDKEKQEATEKESLGYFTNLQRYPISEPSKFMNKEKPVLDLGDFDKTKDYKKIFYELVAWNSEVEKFNTENAGMIAEAKALINIVKNIDLNSTKQDLKSLTSMYNLSNNKELLGFALNGISEAEKGDFLAKIDKFSNSVKTKETEVLAQETKDRTKEINDSIAYMRRYSKSDLKEIQKMLVANLGGNEAILGTTGVDGIMGKRTALAILQLQEKMKIAVDGKVGNATLAMLGLEKQGGKVIVKNGIGGNFLASN